MWLTHADVDLKSDPHDMLPVQAKTVNGEHWGPTMNIIELYLLAKRCAIAWAITSRVSNQDSGTFWSRGGVGTATISAGIYALRKGIRLEILLALSARIGSQLAIRGESLYKISCSGAILQEVTRKQYVTL